MNQGVELVLKRMESHPEEFEVPFIYNDHGYRNSNKWEWLTDRVVRRIERPADEDTVDHLSFLTDEEVHLIYGKLAEIQEGVFLRTVMQTTLNKSKPEEESEYVISASQTVSTSQTQYPQVWGTHLNTLCGAQGPSPVNPIPTPPKITFDAAADAYEITYPNGFSHTIPKSELANLGKITVIASKP